MDESIAFGRVASRGPKGIREHFCSINSATGSEREPNGKESGNEVASQPVPKRSKHSIDFRRAIDALERFAENEFWRAEPAVDYDAAGYRVAYAFDRPHSMRNARVKNRKLIEVRCYKRYQVSGLISPIPLRAAPEIETVWVEEQRFASREVTRLPIGKRKHKGPRPIRRIRVELLPASIDVVAEPWFADCPAA